MYKQVKKLYSTVVIVEWADAIENLEGWHTEEEAFEWAKNVNWYVHQVGWILKETDEYILMSSKFNETSSERESTYGGLMKIPKTWIRKISKLKIWDETT